ncbi:MAG TPA: AzlD domain-containing protein [Anaeromyxobacteraceae bacterium]|nr:AzlD domain-containing protein [Anaeromyxobacteraceae bacterium]
MSWPWVFALAGLATFATRLSFIALLGRVETPRLLQRALRLVPPAVLTAIIVPELVVRDDAADLSPGNLRLLAGLVAMAVALRWRNVLLTIAAGMAALWILQAVAG